MSYFKAKHPDDPVTTVEAFLKLCDAVCVKMTGMTHADLPDRCWVDSYHEGMTRQAAVDAATEILNALVREEGFAELACGDGEE